MTNLTGPVVVECGDGGEVPGPPPTNGVTLVHVKAQNDTPSRILYDNWSRHTVVSFRRAHGTRAAPSAIRAGDTFGEINGFGYGATGYSTSCRAKVTMGASETWTDAGHGAFVEVWTTKKGTLTTERRLRIEDDGAVLHGAAGYEIVDANSLLRAKPIAKANLPSPTKKGLLAFVEDDLGGPTMAYSDGSSWRRFYDRAVVS